MHKMKMIEIICTYEFSYRTDGGGRVYKFIEGGIYTCEVYKDTWTIILPTGDYIICNNMTQDIKSYFTTREDYRDNLINKLLNNQ